MNLEALESEYEETFQPHDELASLTEHATLLACQNRYKFSKYLGMLSYMEFVGARTLLNMLALNCKSSNFAHIIEELNHANSLRNLATKISDEVINYEKGSILCFSASSSYIIRVIKKTHDSLNKYLESNHPEFYPTLVGLVSGILERRTVWWYQFIFKALRTTKLDQNDQIQPLLNSIMDDETSHMIFCDRAIVKSQNLPIEFVTLALNSEKYYFKRFIHAQLKELRAGEI